MKTAFFALSKCAERGCDLFMYCVVATKGEMWTAAIQPNAKVITAKIEVA